MSARPVWVPLVRVACVALALGCSEDPAPHAGRGLRPVVDVPAPPPTPPAPEPSPSARRVGSARGPRLPRPPDLPPEPPNPFDTPAQLGDTEPEAPEVAQAPTAPDLGAALRTAFGAPTDCVSAATRERLTGTLRVNVTVSVTSEGRVTRASVSSSQLSPADLACMRLRAEALRLPGPVPDAPRSVSTSAEYEVRTGSAEPASEAP